MMEKANRLSLELEIESLNAKAEANGLLDGDLLPLKEKNASLDNLYRDEDLFWRQRAKQRWLKDGDRNTRFFQQWASCCRRNNWIHCISLDLGTHSNLEDISRVFRDYYDRLPGVGDGSSIKLWKDRWCLDDRLPNKYPLLFRLSTQPDILVGHAQIPDERGQFLGWNINFTSFVDLRTLHNLEKDLEVLRFTRGADSISWRWTADGAFSTRSLYSILNFCGVNDVFASFLWQ
ncbi:hypothetical protein Cni_G25146 [Canna indica]|uniref:Uncharacterized protein n=1 Tax=Canna indica TaxID=4628 RepID=A0AAQ3KX34_9LILI|nr:hypothetical protein Cni_G25146 [Canna indica]